MNFKYNWGWGISIFYIAFVIFLIGNVIFSGLQRNDLVEENYYEQELKYQERINKMKRYKELPEKINIIQSGNSIVIKFPQNIDKKLIKGKVHFYRPSNSSYDRIEEIKLNDSNFQVLDISTYPNGFWRIKIDWSAGDSTYYYEEDIQVNRS